MKSNLTLLLLFLIVFLTGCNKNKEEVTPALTLEERLTGSWMTSVMKHQFFDASGKLVHEEFIQKDVGDKISFDGKGNISASNYFDYGAKETGAYTLSIKDDKNIIRLTSIVRTAEFEIITLTDNKLVFKGTSFQTLYIKDGLSYRATSAATIEELDRQ